MVEDVRDEWLKPIQQVCGCRLRIIGGCSTRVAVWEEHFAHAVKCICLLPIAPNVPAVGPKNCLDQEFSHSVQAILAYSGFVIAKLLSSMPGGHVYVGIQIGLGWSYLMYVYRRLCVASSTSLFFERAAGTQITFVLWSLACFINSWSWELCQRV